MQANAGPAMTPQLCREQRRFRHAFPRLASARHNHAMAVTSPLHAPRLRSLLAALARGLLERDAPVRLVLLAALAGEHVLLLGPPGTAKSELASWRAGCTVASTAHATSSAC